METLITNKRLISVPIHFFMLLPSTFKQILFQNYMRAGKRSPLSQNGLGGIRIRELGVFAPSFPRPPRCQRGDHTKLIYQPSNTVSINKKHLSIMHQFLNLFDFLVLEQPFSPLLGKQAKKQKMGF